MGLIKLNLFGSSFTWYHFFFAILQSESCEFFVNFDFQHSSFEVKGFLIVRLSQSHCQPYRL